MRVGAVAVAVVLVAACSSSSSSSSSSPASSSSSSTGLLTLNPDHDYGNKYADGILPVGDGKYTTDVASMGSVFLCNAVVPNVGGAQTRGSWFSADGTTYDTNKKISVQGTVEWPGEYSNAVDGATRRITTNDLPRDHPTGVFPVASSDPAFAIDRNPNSIKTQSLTYSLAASPTIDATPHCLRGVVGVMTTGVQLFDAFDAGLRDAGAWEVQDGCQGHPEITGAYHYHSLSSCIADTSVSTVIGFALDGLPITGPKVAEGNVLTTDDLDECHGIASSINLDGRQIETYHYVMTQDFPYSASCFRANPTKAPGTP